MSALERAKRRKDKLFTLELRIAELEEENAWLRSALHGIKLLVDSGLLVADHKPEPAPEVEG